MFDLAIVGSGFAGSLLATIARRFGRSVLLIEREKHPRFAIGESSTPLANLLLEELATRYELPDVLPFTKWGTWQRDRPEVASGLKRGFSFFHHSLGNRWANDPAHDDQLLVAASPNDEIADTHWYRPDFDAALARAAADAGATYVDQVELESIEFSGDSVHLEGSQGTRRVQYAARFLVDATGPRGFTHRALSLTEAPLPHLPATSALYAHFTGVGRFSDVAGSALEATPYPVDDAAVHHVFDGGWIWVLRFNNGITSAGIAATAGRAREWQFERGEAAWTDLLSTLPSVRDQFREARATVPFRHQPQLGFRSGRWSGEQWTQLPSAAGFIDPLLSTGFPLTLLGVTRLARAIEQDWGTSRFLQSIQTLSRDNEADFFAAERLIAALYAQMHDFPIFRALSLLYFAAASFSECQRRLRSTDRDEGFLLHRTAHFTPFRSLCARAIAGIRSEDRAQFLEDVSRAIEPINVAGLAEPARGHWYPADLHRLVEHTDKLGASRCEIEAMLARIGAVQ